MFITIHVNNFFRYSTFIYFNTYIEYYLLLLHFDPLIFYTLIHLTYHRQTRLLVSHDTFEEMYTFYLLNQILLYFYLFCLPLKILLIYTYVFWCYISRYQISILIWFIYFKILSVIWVIGVMSLLLILLRLWNYFPSSKISNSSPNLTFPWMEESIANKEFRAIYSLTNRFCNIWITMI